MSAAFAMWKDVCTSLPPNLSTCTAITIWVCTFDRSINQSFKLTVFVGTYAQIHQTIYMFSAEWKASHSWHSCKNCATLTGGLRVIGSDTDSASLDRSANQIWQLQTLGNQIRHDAHYIHDAHTHCILALIWQSMKAALMALQPVLTKPKPSQSAPQLEAVDLLEILLQPDISFIQQVLLHQVAFAGLHDGRDFCRSWHHPVPLTWNVMGFTTITDELELIIGEHDPDIIVLTET